MHASICVRASYRPLALAVASAARFRVVEGRSGLASVHGHRPADHSLRRPLARRPAEVPMLLTSRPGRRPAPRAIPACPCAQRIAPSPSRREASRDRGVKGCTRPASSASTSAGACNSRTISIAASQKVGGRAAPMTLSMTVTHGHRVPPRRPLRRQSVRRETHRQPGAHSIGTIARTTGRSSAAKSPRSRSSRTAAGVCYGLAHAVAQSMAQPLEAAEMAAEFRGGGGSRTHQSCDRRRSRVQRLAASPSRSRTLTHRRGHRLCCRMAQRRQVTRWPISWR